MHQKVLSLFFLLFTLSPAQAQKYFPVSDSCSDKWVWLQPYPIGGAPSQIFLTHQGIVAYDGHWNGVNSRYVGEHSSDNGKTWDIFCLLDTLNDTLLIGPGEGSVTFVNSTAGFFESDADGKILKTTDGGIHWFFNGGQMPTALNGNFHMISESFFWGVADSIYTTTNAGKEWHSLIVDTVARIALSFPSVFFMDSLRGFVWESYTDSLGSTDRFLQTTNGGLSWGPHKGKSFSYWGLVFTDTLHGIGNSGVNVRSFFYTLDGGHSWRPFATQLTDSGTDAVKWVTDSLGVVTALTYDPPVIIMGTTTDYGTTWQRDTSIVPDNVYGENGMRLLGHGVIATIGSLGGLTVSTDHGKTWSHNNDLGLASKNDAFFLDRNSGFILTDKGLFRTRDAGRNFKLVLPDTSGGFRYYSASKPNCIWVGDYRSLDSGNTFQRVTTLPKNPPPISMQFVDSLVGWGFTFWDGIWKTTDGAKTWSKQRSDIPANNTTLGTFYSASMVDREYGWMVGDVFLRTTNGGDKWDTMNVNLGTSFSTRIYFANHEHGFVYADGVNAETTDGGATWHDMVVHGLTVHFRDSLFGWSGGHVTTNGGATWRDLGCPYAFDFLTPGAYWWADTNEGWYTVGNFVFHYGGFDSVNVGVAEHRNQIPASTILLENYPNPFSESTELIVSTPFIGALDDHATITLCDQLGRVVTDLTSQFKNGNSTIHVSGRALTAGVYSVVIRTQNHVESKLIMLTK